MKRLLIVDDDASLLNVLAKGLSTGWDVTTAGNANDALRILNEQQFDFIITDYEMGASHDGVWLLKKAIQINSKMRRILYSGSAPEEQTMSENPGLIDIFIEKPAGLQDIMAALS